MPIRLDRYASVLLLLVIIGCSEDDEGEGAAGMSGQGAASALAAIAPFGAGTVTGTASFTQTGTDVTITVTLNDCPDGPHGVHIHQGTSCVDAASQGDHWDMMRGELIPDVMCAGGTGTSTHTRAAANPALTWSIGGDPVTNVIGHAFVVHEPGMPAPRIGCGLIAAAP